MPNGRSYVIRVLVLCANKTPWYMTPLISMLTTNELSIPALPSPASKKHNYLLIMFYVIYKKIKNSTTHRNYIS
jgi:hypothetical protein